MSRMDRQGARTPADLERKYNFGRSFAELEGIALDAQTHAYNAEEAVKSWSQSVESDFKDIYAELDMRLEVDENNNLIGKVHIGANQLTIDTDNFTLDESGNVKIEGEINAKAGGRLATWDISEKGIFKNTNSTLVNIDAPNSANEDVITVATIENGTVKDTPFFLKANGFLYTKDCYIEGEINAKAGFIGDWSIFDNVLTADYNFTLQGVDYTDTIQLSPTALTVIRKESGVVIGNSSETWYYVAQAAKNAQHGYDKGEPGIGIADISIYAK